MTTSSTPDQEAPGPAPAAPGRSARGPRHGLLGWVVLASVAGGLVAAVLLAALPVVPAEPSELTGAVLCGFALGWALLAVLSARLTDRPQRWAWAPALVMGVGGLLLIAFGPDADEPLGWVWPPVVLVLSIWMFVRVRRGLRGSSGRWLLYPVVAVLAIASVAGGIETVLAATATDYAMPGRLVDVGGHRLHLHCTGSGSPTVVLEPGAGLMSSTMGWIAPAVARDTRVCVYDRAGRGWSDPADEAQDAARIATDLHTLLHRANVPGPYVLAGHSFGGLYALTYADRYPDDVAGMVLIDSTAPARSGATRSSRAGSGDPMRRVSALLSSTARFGVARLVASLDQGSLPPRSRAEARASAATADHLRSTIDEYARANASAKEAAALRSFGDKPLVVLTAGKGSAAGWMAKQDRLAALSGDSAHRTVAGAAHIDLVVDERAAAATSRAVLDVVAAVRSGRALAG